MASPNNMSEYNHLRPNPNAAVNSSSISVPSLAMNLSGRKASGSGYISGSCKIALERIGQNSEKMVASKMCLTHQELPVTIEPFAVTHSMSEVQQLEGEHHYQHTFGDEHAVIHIVL